MLQWTKSEVEVAIDSAAKAAEVNPLHRGAFVAVKDQIFFCYTLLPLVFDHLRSSGSSIISPLTALMLE